jgi:ferredoxin
MHALQRLLRYMPRERGEGGLMVRLKINGKEVQIANGATLLDAAHAVGVEIPTLCYLKETGALTSCMICAVRDKSSGRLLPACAAKAADGMDIDTDCEKVHEARREVLRMLLDEHVGDCEAPCSRICPAGLNIPRMLRHVEKNEAEAAARRAKLDLIFPATLGHVCTAPCERVCRRGQYDTAIAIRQSHRDASMPFLSSTIGQDARRMASGLSVGIVGAGLAGMAAAWECAMNGHTCKVYEKRDHAGAKLRALPTATLPAEVLDAEIESVRAMGVEFVFNCEAGVGLSLAVLLEEHDAVIVACNLSFTPHAKIFTAKEEALHVRAVGGGKKTARGVNAFLSDQPAPKADKCFNSSIGRLRQVELDPYAVERRKNVGQEPPPVNPGKIDSSRQPGAPVPHETAVPHGDDSRGRLSYMEAARCLHCDCTKPTTCKLRRYAEQYGLGPQITRTMERLPVAPIQSADGVLFEPGKCIKCGICVEIVRASGLDAGIAFAGRGLASHLQVPFGGTLAKGFGSVAERCVQACPTAALSFRDAEES